MKKKERKDKFIEKQAKTCTEHPSWSFSSRMFMSEDGYCYSCNKYIIDKEIEKGNDGSKMVTGCPLCSRSYCD